MKKLLLLVVFCIVCASNSFCWIIPTYTLRFFFSNSNSAHEKLYFRLIDNYQAEVISEEGRGFIIDSNSYFDLHYKQRWSPIAKYNDDNRLVYEIVIKYKNGEMIPVGRLRLQGYSFTYLGNAFSPP